MSKVIEITKCGECPYFNRHTSEDGNTIFYATCSHPDALKLTDPVIAATIPEWCPLEDSEDFAESNFDIDRKF